MSTAPRGGRGRGFGGGTRGWARGEEPAPRGERVCDRGTVEAIMEREQQKLYCQIIAHLVLVDEEVSDAEHAFLEAQMDRFEFDDAARDEVLEGLDMTKPIAELAAQLTADAGADLLKVLHDAAQADDHFDERERALIGEVEAVLGAAS